MYVSMMSVACRCGHAADLDEFILTLGGTRLRPGQYQCRACGLAWEVRPKGKARLGWSGMVIPAGREIVEVQAIH